MRRSQASPRATAGREDATVRIRADAAGVSVDAGSYRLRVDASGTAALADPADRPWAELATTFAADGVQERDETTAPAPPVVREDGGTSTIVVRLSSSRWRSKELLFTCRDDGMEIAGRVEGAGEIGDCRLLGGWGAAGEARSSRASFATVFTPEPTAPPRLAHAASESSSIDVVSASYPRTGHWFFTPPPFCFALARDVATGAHIGDGGLPKGPWLTVGLATPRGAHNYTAFAYDGARDGFAFRLAYEGRTRVDGIWTTPALVFGFDDADPYAGIGRHTAWLRTRGLVDVPQRAPAAWWSRPLFCGWGEQVWLARERAPEGRYWLAAAEFSRQDLYDHFLATLTGAGLDPGTIVIDDKWQQLYAQPHPDPARWPDMRGWIARRHDEDRHVLLWWNAWSPEGLPAEQTVRDRDGRPVTVDPSSPSYEAHLRASVAHMLSPHGLDADGFKVDFTASTPTGVDLSHHGPEWGVELLRKLIATIHAAAHETKPDALVMTHTPNPYFAAVSDMIRLNDILRMEDSAPDYPIVDEMRHRARVAQAACPELLIDTDNWPCPTREAWRSYVALQPELGVPSLYYATHIDMSAEPLEDRDYAAVRDAWARHAERRRHAVPQAVA